MRRSAFVANDTLSEPLNGSILPERGDGIDPPCTQRRNQRGTGARRDDAEQAGGVGDGIEEAYGRPDLLCRRRRQEAGPERDRQAAAEEQPEANGSSRL